MPFQQLGLAAPIQQAVKESGYTEPTPIQAAAIPVILQRNDLMGIARQAQERLPHSFSHYFL